MYAKYIIMYKNTFITHTCVQNPSGETKPFSGNLKYICFFRPPPGDPQGSMEHLLHQNETLRPGNPLIRSGKKLKKTKTIETTFEWIAP